MDAASQGFNKATANQPSSVGDDVVSASKKSMSPFYRLPSFFSLPFLISSPLLFHIVVLLFASTKPSLWGQDLWLQHVRCIFSGFPSFFPLLSSLFYLLLHISSVLLSSSFHSPITSYPRVTSTAAKTTKLAISPSHLLIHLRQYFFSFFCYIYFFLF